jgi:nitrogen fixation protein NifU and related proteins
MVPLRPLMLPPSAPGPADDDGTADATGSPALTSTALEALYQERILAHFRHPHGKGTLDTPDVVGTAHNLLCGEQVTVTVALDRTAAGTRVRDVRFSSDGCSISQASASMMTDLVRGLTPQEIGVLSTRLRAVVSGDVTAARDETLGPLVAMSALARVPARIACATLAWDALERAVGRQRPLANGEQDQVSGSR